MKTMTDQRRSMKKVMDRKKMHIMKKWRTKILDWLKGKNLTWKSRTISLK